MFGHAMLQFDKTLRIKELSITRASSCINLNPPLSPPLFLSSDSQVRAARNRAPYQGALSCLNYMKVS